MGTTPAEIMEAIRVVASMNAYLNETNESGFIPYVGIASTGDEFDISYLGQQLWSSSEDSLEDEDIEVNPGPHSDGLSEEGKKLEQILWNKVKEVHDDLELQSKYIHAMTTTGRGLE